MNVRDLTRDELIELKQRYYTDHCNDSPSYGELADVDALVTDEEVFEEYADVDFVEDDFFSNLGGAEN